MCPSAEAKAGASQQVIPVERASRRGPRPIGAYVITDGHIRYQPAVDVERLVIGVVAVAGAAAALGAAIRRGPAVNRISMGHGGWVSIKGERAHPGEHRPWWARLLGAHQAGVGPAVRRKRDVRP